jgi:hypothetical protein
MSSHYSIDGPSKESLRRQEATLKAKFRPILGFFVLYDMHVGQYGTAGKNDCFDIYADKNDEIEEWTHLNPGSVTIADERC